MKGQPSRKSIKYLQLRCRGKCECFGMVLWSRRAAHKVMGFFGDQRFSRVGLCCSGEAGWRLGPQQCTRSLALLPEVSLLVGVGSTAALRFHPRGTISALLCHHLLKVLSETCGYKTPSYEYKCRFVSNVYINYPVKVDVQLHWCDSQKHWLCQTESAFSSTGELETLPHHQAFASSHLCYVGKKVRGKLQVLSVLLK